MFDRFFLLGWFGFVLFSNRLLKSMVLGLSTLQVSRHAAGMHCQFIHLVVCFVQHPRVWSPLKTKFYYINSDKLQRYRRKWYLSTLRTVHVQVLWTSYEQSGTEASNLTKALPLLSLSQNNQVHKCRFLTQGDFAAGFGHLQSQLLACWEIRQQVSLQIWVWEKTLLKTTAISIMVSQTDTEMEMRWWF